MLEFKLKLVCDELFGEGNCLTLHGISNIPGRNEIVWFEYAGDSYWATIKTVIHDYESKSIFLHFSEYETFNRPE